MSSLDHCGAAIRAAAVGHVGEVVRSLRNLLGITPPTFWVLNSVPGARSKCGELRFGATQARHAGRASRTAGSTGCGCTASGSSDRGSRTRRTGSRCGCPSPNDIVDCLYSKNCTRVQPVWVNVLKNVLGRWQFVEGDVAGAAGGQGDDDLVIQSGAPGSRDVDDRQAHLGAEVGSEEPALLALVELRPVEADGLAPWPECRPSRHSRRSRPRSGPGCGQVGHPVLHRAVGEHVHPAGAVGALDDGPSNTKMSSGRSPLAQSQNTFWAFLPSSSPSEGCQIRSGRSRRSDRRRWVPRR